MIFDYFTAFWQFFHGDLWAKFGVFYRFFWEQFVFLRTIWLIYHFYAAAVFIRFWLFTGFHIPIKADFFAECLNRLLRSLYGQNDIFTIINLQNRGIKAV